MFLCFRPWSDTVLFQGGPAETEPMESVMAECGAFTVCRELQSAGQEESPDEVFVGLLEKPDVLCIRGCCSSFKSFTGSLPGFFYSTVDERILCIYYILLYLSPTSLGIPAPCLGSPRM